MKRRSKRTLPRKPSDWTSRRAYIADAGKIVAILRTAQGTWWLVRHWPARSSQGLAAPGPGAKRGAGHRVTGRGAEGGWAGFSTGGAGPAAGGSAALEESATRRRRSGIALARPGPGTASWGLHPARGAGGGPIPGRLAAGHQILVLSTEVRILPREQYRVTGLERVVSAAGRLGANPAAYSRRLVCPNRCVPLPS